MTLCSLVLFACSCGIVRVLEIYVKTGAGGEHRAAIFVVAGVIDVLQIEGDEETAPEVRGIESFDDFFGAVSKIAITQEKSEAAEREIFLMSLDDSVGDEGHAGAIVVAIPPIALREAADFGGAIVFGIGERFVAAVAPSEAPEYAYSAARFPARNSVRIRIGGGPGGGWQ